MMLVWLAIADLETLPKEKLRNWFSLRSCYLPVKVKKAHLLSKQQRNSCSILFRTYILKVNKVKKIQWRTHFARIFFFFFFVQARGCVLYRVYVCVVCVCVHLQLCMICYCTLFACEIIISCMFSTDWVLKRAGIFFSRNLERILSLKGAQLADRRSSLLQQPRLHVYEITKTDSLEGFAYSTFIFSHKPA